jgi:tetratricopeptide (TPR) repeat protein
MKKIAILFISTFLLLSFLVKSQTLQKSDPISKIENAKYLKGDLTKELKSNIKYPRKGLVNNIQGDVILSFIIDRNGKLDSLAILNSPDVLLSTTSIVAFSEIDNEWSPCKINEQPIGQSYLIIFRYRRYLNEVPPEYKNKAEKFFKKQKYEKALKYYDKAIKDNQYDSELFESRSKIKEVLGDIEGAKLDKLISANLKNKIISIVDIEAIGKTRTETRTVTTVTREVLY